MSARDPFGSPQEGQSRRKDYNSSEHRRRDRSRSPRESYSRRRDDDRDGDRHRDSGRSRHHDDDDDEHYKSKREHRHHPHDRSRSRSSYPRRRSRSPPAKKRRASPPAEPASPPRRSRAPLPSQLDSFRGEVGPSGGAPGEPLPEKQKPNFKPTGLLAKEANTIAGTKTVLKYHEPPEARKPSSRDQWRMYVFKKKDLLDTVHLYTRSVWLMGRDEKVADLHLEHPSISKQHAVIQFRYITTTNEYGDRLGKVKPYLIDLDSANGTRLNGKEVESSRFVELIDGDVVKFGDSEREYVMMLPSKDG